MGYRVMYIYIPQELSLENKKRQETIHSRFAEIPGGKLSMAVRHCYYHLTGHDIVKFDDSGSKPDI
jgi:hypothetical protein